MGFKVLVPRPMIPKIDVVCQECGGPVKTTIATAYSEGYHRRHECRECHAVFHTLAPWGGTEYYISKPPFKDRPLNDFERAQRAQWWDDYEKGVLAVKLPSTVTIPPLLKRMASALAMSEGERGPVEKFLVAGYDALRARVAGMEASDDPARKGGS